MSLDLAVAVFLICGGLPRKLLVKKFLKSVKN